MTQTTKKNERSSAFKFKVALEAIKGNKTTAELCHEFGVASSQVFAWKKELLEKGCEVFGKGKAGLFHPTQEIDNLHATIGRLKVENDFLSHVLGRPR